MLTITWKSENKQNPDWTSTSRVLYDLPIMRSFFVGDYNGVDVEVTENEMRDFLKWLHRNEDSFTDEEKDDGGIYDQMESFAFFMVNAFKWNVWTCKVNCKW